MPLVYVLNDLQSANKTFWFHFYSLSTIYIRQNLLCDLPTSYWQKMLERKAVFLFILVFISRQ